MQEAADAIGRIEEAAPAAVELMVQYIYKATLPEDAPLVQLFGLAKKYSLAGLATEVGMMMLKGFGITNALERVRVVRLHAHAGDIHAAGLWDKMCLKLYQDK